MYIHVFFTEDPDSHYLYGPGPEYESSFMVSWLLIYVYNDLNALLSPKQKKGKC